jgi:hypothetical protein
MGIFTGVVFHGLIGRFFGNSQGRHVFFYEFANVRVYGFMGSRIIRKIMPQIQPYDINRIKSFVTPCPYLIHIFLHNWQKILTKNAHAASPIFSTVPD